MGSFLITFGLIRQDRLLDQSVFYRAPPARYKFAEWGFAASHYPNNKYQCVLVTYIGVVKVSTLFLVMPGGWVKHKR